MPDQLNLVYRNYLGEVIDDTISTENANIFSNLLDQTYQDPITHRLVMPCVWDQNLVDSITKKFSLSKSILFANLRKLQKNKERLHLYDSVIQTQLSDGVIVKVADSDPLLKCTDATFLGHSGVFTEKNNKMKCRVVYLSNLKEHRVPGFSHNDASVPGMNFNSKIAFAITQLRFDKFLFVFDLVKAFLQIQIKEEDQKKLLFLWVKDVDAPNMEIQVFKFVRLMFGLRFSPNMLMTALQIILLRDTYCA